MTNPSETGFTLTEMLVALGVTGLAALLLAQATGRVELGLAAWHGQNARDGAIAAAQFTLRHRLAQMQPLPDIQAGAGAVAMQGRAEAVDFLAPAPDGDAPDALRRYRLLRDGAGHLVLFSLSSLDTRVDPRATATAGWRAEPLLDGVVRLDIRYWGRGPAALDDAPVWQSAWVGRAALPMLVRISVQFPAGDRRQWPDLIVHPAGAVPEPCPETAPCGAKAKTA